MKKQLFVDNFVPLTERKEVAGGRKTKLITVQVARKSSALPSLIQQNSPRTVLQINQTLAEISRYTDIEVKPSFSDFELISADMEMNSTSVQEVHHVKENPRKSPSTEVAPSLGGDPTTVGIFFGDGGSETSGENVARKRTSYSEEQITELEAAYYTNPYPTNETRIDLAFRLNVHESKVKIWFQNRRARAKKRDVKPFWMQDPKTFQLPTLSEGGDVKSGGTSSLIKSRINRESYHHHRSNSSSATALVCYGSVATSSGCGKLEPAYNAVDTRVNGMTTTAAGYVVDASGASAADVKKENEGDGPGWNRSKYYPYYNEITGLPSKFPVLGSTTTLSPKVKSEKFRTLEGGGPNVQQHHQFYQDQILIDQIHHADDVANSGGSFEWPVASSSTSGVDNSNHHHHHVLQQDMNVQVEVVDRPHQSHINKFPSIVPSPPPPVQQRLFVPTQTIGKRNVGNGGGGGFVKTTTAKIGDGAPTYHQVPTAYVSNEPMSGSSNGQGWSYQYLTDAYNSSGNYIAMQ